MKQFNKARIILGGPRNCDGMGQASSAQSAKIPCGR